MAARITKAQIVSALEAAGVTHDGVDLKKLTVKKLTALAEENNVVLEDPATEPVTEGSGEISDEAMDKIVEEGAEKFAYLADKEPTEKHYLHAALATAMTGVRITPKQAQIVIICHDYIQKTNANKARKGYHPRRAGAVIQGFETLMERVSDQLPEDVIGVNTEELPEEMIQRIREVMVEQGFNETAEPEEEVEGEVVEGEVVGEIVDVEQAEPDNEPVEDQAQDEEFVEA